MFSNNTEILKCNIKNISSKYLVKIVRNITRKVTIIILLTTHNNFVKNFKWFYKSKGNKEKIRPLKDFVPAWKNKYIIIVFELLSTLPDTPLKCLFTAVLVMVMPKNASSRSPLSVWEYEFELV